MYRYSRVVMGIWMAVSDILALLISVSIPVLIWSRIDPALPLDRYLTILPGIIAFLLALLLVSGLYPGIGIRSHILLQRMYLVLSVGFLFLGTATFYMRNALDWSRGAFVVSWILTLLILPHMRALMRQFGLWLKIWGEPVAIIGFGPTGRRIYSTLTKHSQLGFQPVVAYGGVFPQPDINFTEKFSQRSKADDLLNIQRIQTAILVTDEISREVQRNVLDSNLLLFPRRILVNCAAQGLGGGTLYQLGGIFGSEEYNALHSFWQPFVKRFIDIFVTLALAILWLPLGGVIALLIRISSPGPVFFCQTRLGQNGIPFKIIKFRSMVANASEVLAVTLQADNDKKREWGESYKLKNDPRVTRIGKILRRTSLDELPQMFNVLQGTMSLVGPRPIIVDEVRLYQDKYKTFSLVKPGLTGLWQTSGRNDLTYPERVNLDVYYARNWSFWLDLDILYQTPWVMLSGEGAY